jgi:hypothetical protein
VDELPILGADGDRRTLQQIIALHGAPAFVRRTQQVQEALTLLVEGCRQQRTAWLMMVRLQLGTLAALAGDWAVLRPWLADEDHLEVLRRLHAELRPELRVPVARTTSGRALQRALAELVAGLERFNGRWRDYLHGVDLGRVNALREGYNKYYMLEKECVVRSPRLARQGFQPLPPLTAADLLVFLPPLPVPRLR